MQAGVAWLVSASLVIGSQASAQSALARQDEGSTVRVTIVDGPTREGRVISHTVDSLLLDLEGSSSVAVAEIDQLWVRRSEAGTGGAIGAIVLGGARSAS
jgi:hypothetical protein